MDKEYFLATTAIEEFWDASKPILFLGEWCLRYSRKKFWESLDYQVMPSYMDDDKVLKYSQDYVTSFYNSVLPKFASRLNLIHNLSYSKRFWQIIVGPWLYFYITALYDRYMNLKNAFSMYENLTTTILDEECFVVAENSKIFFDYLDTDYYNLQLYSRIIVALGKKYKKKHYLDFNNLNKQFVTKKNSKFKLLIKKYLIAIHNKIMLFFCNKKSIILVNPYFSKKICWALSLLSKMKILFLDSCDIKWPKVHKDDIKRKFFNNLNISTDEFESIFFNLLPFDIPIGYIENLDFVIKKSNKLYPNHAAVIFSSGGWYSSETFEYWAAKLAEQNVIITGMQHGGNYGVLFYHPHEMHETSIVDKYFTWGWRKEHKHIPMSVNKLMGRKHIKKTLSGDILWGTTIFTRYTHTLYEMSRMKECS